MQDDFKQKKWNDIDDQSKNVNNLPLEDHIDQNNDNNSPVNKNDINLDLQGNNINSNLDSELGLNIGNQHISYVDGVPIIHSISNESDQAETEDKEIEAMNKILEREKRVKIFVSVFGMVVVIFGSAVLAYLYYKNKAEQSLVNNPVTINNNSSALSSNTSNINQQNTARSNTQAQNASGQQSPEVSMRINNSINNTSENIAPGSNQDRSRKDIKNVWIDIPSDIASKVLDYEIKEREYIIIYANKNSSFDIRDFDTQNSISLIKKVFNIESIDQTFRDTIYESHPVKIHNAKVSLLIIAEIDGNIVFADGFSSLKQAIIAILD